MSKTACKVLIIVFCAFILTFSIYFIIQPDREFSEQENRYLAQAPSLTFSGLFTGDFTSDFEKYLSDQFPGRDSWITLKAGSELALGKTQNNGVYYCGDDTLIEKLDEPDTAQVASSLAAINRLAEGSGCEIYFQLIPTSAEIWSDRLPENAQSADQQALISYCYENVSVETVDIASVLREHSDEYIYYRTDHHWTTLGAYYGYTALAKAMGFTPSPLSDYSRETVTEAFYGTTWSSSGFSWVKADSIERFVPETDEIKVTNYPNGSPVEGELYDDSFLGKKDKYSMFFGGNTPLLHIETGAESGKKLLVLRDSYADCFTPFLFDEFSEIYQMDLRYYKTSLSDFIAENGIDTILLCYSTKTFATDTSLFLLGQ